MATENRQTRYLYEEIRDEILRRIKEGEYHVEQRLPSTRALVEEFSTTPVTINRALSDLVESGHITRVAKSGSFVNARDQWNGGTRARTGLVGIIAFDMKVSVYWTQVVEAMQQALESRSMHAVIGYSEHSFDKAHNYVDDLIDKGIDGLIYVPIDAPSEHQYEEQNRLVCEHIERRGVPFVLFDRRLADDRFSSVTADVYGAGEQLMDALAKAGSKRPLCLTVEYSQAIRGRELAFLAAASRLDMQVDDSRILRFPSPRVYSHQISEFARMITNAPSFDALYIANSNLYSNFLRVEATEQKRWDVPIVTFRDLETAQPERPVARALQPVRPFGAVAGQLLSRLIEGDVPGTEFGAYQHIVVPIPIEVD
ncbi:MAG: GntR family transcriptional regulator [Spirochaetales bacterium]